MAFRIAPALEQPKLKRPRQKAENHLAFIRTLPCLVTGQRNVDAAHIRMGSLRHGKRETGLGEKPHDAWTVPLSREEHARQHAMNEAAYWRGVGIDPLFVASLLWLNTGDTLACEAVIRLARSVRHTLNTQGASDGD